MKALKRILLLAALASVTACVYPFEAEIPEGSSSVVIEGDIVVGGITTANLGKVFPIGTKEENMTTVTGQVWVEDDKGFNYFGDYDGKGYQIDTRTAPKDRRYRLCVICGGKHYFSDWIEPQPAPVIDGLIYKVHPTSIDMLLSMHSDCGCQYYRWTYRENWRYHADYIREYNYDYETGNLIKGRDYSTYYCRSTVGSNEIGLCATTDLVSDRIEERKFLTVQRTSKKLQMEYHLTVTARCISADAYRYLDNLKLTSNYTGDLFSPNPSQMNGNIHCEEDPSEIVMGYVDAGIAVEANLDILQSQAKLFLESSRQNYSIEILSEYLYDQYYRMGWRPIYEGMADGEMGIAWGPRRCYDCTTEGGYLE